MELFPLHEAFFARSSLKQESLLIAGNIPTRCSGTEIIKKNCFHGGKFNESRLLILRMQGFLWKSINLYKYGNKISLLTLYLNLPYYQWTIIKTKSNEQTE